MRAAKSLEIRRREALEHDAKLELEQIVARENREREERERVQRLEQERLEEQRKATDEARDARTWPQRLSAPLV